MDLCIKTDRRYVNDFEFSSFNPCFNGSMYKNNWCGNRWRCAQQRFNPCFNGSMYKNQYVCVPERGIRFVSILVLMDLCIKTFMILALHI